MRRVTLDFVTDVHTRFPRDSQDPTNDEVVLYLVDDGPWPDDDAAWTARLRPTQDWLYGAVDVAVDGHLAANFPEVRGKRVRIQIDSPSGCPPRLQQFVDRFKRALTENQEYREAILVSEVISGLRVVTGHEMGRFR